MKDPSRSAVASADSRPRSPPKVTPPECPVCWETYDLDSQSPRIIACGHSICERCAANLPHTHDVFGKRCISCPECRCLVVWKGLASMPKNFALQKVVGELSSGTKPTARRPARPLLQQLDAWTMVSYISNMASVISVLFGVLLAMLVFIPVCFAYLALSWLTASITFFAFSLLTCAALGVGTAQTLSFVFGHITGCCQATAYA